MLLLNLIYMFFAFGGNTEPSQMGVILPLKTLPLVPQEELAVVSMNISEKYLFMASNYEPPLFSDLAHISFLNEEKKCQATILHLRTDNSVLKIPGRLRIENCLKIKAFENGKELAVATRDKLIVAHPKQVASVTLSTKQQVELATKIKNAKLMLAYEAVSDEPVTFNEEKIEWNSTVELPVDGKLKLHILTVESHSQHENYSGPDPANLPILVAESKDGKVSLVGHSRFFTSAYSVFAGRFIITDLVFFASAHFDGLIMGTETEYKGYQYYRVTPEGGISLISDYNGTF